MNRNRILYLDIAKGFAIIFMFTLLGTAPAAPVFMIIMGAFTMRSRSGVKDQILRGITLAGLGYILNLLRLPMFISDAMLFNILTFNDILQLAGLSIIAGTVLKRFLSRPVFPPLLIAAILLISPSLWGLFPENPITLMFWGATEQINFPFFPWVVYPLLGMYLSRFLLEDEARLDRRLNRLAVTGLFLLVIAGGFIMLRIFPVGDYSRSGLGIHLLIIGFVFIWLRMCRFIEVKLPPGSGLIRILSFLSINITTIYFIQWILFSWSILIFDANNQNPYTAAAIGLAVFLVTCALVKNKIIRNLCSFTRV
jgi:hypothetical protein